MFIVITGLDGSGTSTIAEKFARDEYKSYILIDFNIASKRVKDNFYNLNELDVFFQNLSLEYNTRLYPRESLISSNVPSSYSILIMYPNKVVYGSENGFVHSSSYSSSIKTFCCVGAMVTIAGCFSMISKSVVENWDVYITSIFAMFAFGSLSGYWILDWQPTKQNNKIMTTVTRQTLVI